MRVPFAGEHCFSKETNPETWASRPQLYDLSIKEETKDIEEVRIVHITQLPAYTQGKLEHLDKDMQEHFRGHAQINKPYKKGNYLYK